MRLKKGFTLVEVMIVLVIMTIIAAIAVPSISGFMEASYSRNCSAAISGLENSVKNAFSVSRIYDREIDDYREYVTNYILLAAMGYIREPIDASAAEEQKLELKNLCERSTIELSWKFHSTEKDDAHGITTVPVTVSIKCKEHSTHDRVFDEKLSFKDFPYEPESYTTDQIAYDYAAFVTDKAYEYISAGSVGVIDAAANGYTYTDADGKEFSAIKTKDPVYFCGGDYETLGSFTDDGGNTVVWKELIENYLPEEETSKLRTELKDDIYIFMDKAVDDGNAGTGKLQAYCYREKKALGIYTYTYVYHDGTQKIIENSPSLDKNELCYYAYGYYKPSANRYVSMAREMADAIYRYSEYINEHLDMLHANSSYVLSHLACIYIKGTKSNNAYRPNGLDNGKFCAYRIDPSKNTLYGVNKNYYQLSTASHLDGTKTSAEISTEVYDVLKPMLPTFSYVTMSRAFIAFHPDTKKVTQNPFVYNGTANTKVANKGDATAIVLYDPKITAKIFTDAEKTKTGTCAFIELHYDNELEDWYIYGFRISDGYTSNNTPETRSMLVYADDDLAELILAKDPSVYKS